MTLNYQKGTRTARSRKVWKTLINDFRALREGITHKRRIFHDDNRVPFRSYENDEMSEMTQNYKKACKQLSIGLKRAQTFI